MTGAYFGFSFQSRCCFFLGSHCPGQTDDPGMMMFNDACRTCHTIREGDNRLGQNLYGIIGRKSGTTSGYHGYSSSMQNADIVWDEKNLEQFITKPEAVVLRQ